MSPEYGSFGHVSTKIDVYSFGVLVLEVISGRRCIDWSKPPDEQILSDWVCINHATKALNDVFFLEIQSISNDGIMLFNNKMVT